jgi:hypothetical protein
MTSPPITADESDVGCPAARGPDALDVPAHRPTTDLHLGSTSFVESVAATLIDIGHDPSWIRLERYGNATEAS